MKIGFATPSTPKVGAYVVGVLKDGVLTAPAAEADSATGGQVARALKASPRFEGKAEQTLTLTAPANVPYESLILIGLGDPAKLDALAAEKIGAAAISAVLATGAEEAAIALDAGEGAALDATQLGARAAMGARLKSYRFDKYRTTEKPEKKPRLNALTILAPEGVQAQYETLDRIADGVTLTRDLVSEPANTLYPESFAERCKALETDALKIEVLDEPALEKLGMRALLGVGQGSARETRVVVFRYEGGPAGEAPLAFIGKGVTFDTGGISLKPGAGMGDMKFDMAGAGVVTGLMQALAGRKAKVNAVGVIGLVENMPSATAQRPGDVVTSMSGQTIEILNTDAEGRLVLADVLWYAQDRFKPRLMVDLATLTGAILVALGETTAGLFANDDEIAERLTAAGKQVGEPVWRLPLGEEFDRQIDSDIADMKNIASNRWAGSIIAAQFLKRFVNDTPWAHLDIAGAAWTHKPAPLAPKGATGFGVRLLDRFVADHYEG